MDDTDPFPNDIERVIIRMFLLKEPPPQFIPPARVEVKIRGSGVWALLECDPSLLPIASIWPDGRLQTIAPAFTEDEGNRISAIRFIFKELGDPRAGQPVDMWFPGSDAIQQMCGPMTLLAYRAAQWTSRHYRSEKQP